MMTILIALPVLILAVAFGALFLWIGASVAGIDNRSYGKAFMATLIDGIVGMILNAALGFIGLKHGMPFLIALPINLFIIKSVFDCGWGKALLAWLIQLVAIVVIVVVPVVLLLGTAALFG